MSQKSHTAKQLFSRSIKRGVWLEIRFATDSFSCPVPTTELSSKKDVLCSSFGFSMSLKGCLVQGFSQWCFLTLCQFGIADRYDNWCYHL